MPGVGRVAGRLVADGGRACALPLHGGGGDAVNVQRGEAGLDVRRDFVQHFAGQAAGFAHGGDVGVALDGDGHAQGQGMERARIYRHALFKVLHLLAHLLDEHFHVHADAREFV